MINTNMYNQILTKLAGKVGLIPTSWHWSNTLDYFTAFWTSPKFTFETIIQGNIRE